MEIIQIPFSSIISDVTSKFNKIPNKDFIADGLYPIIDQGANKIAGYTNNKASVTDFQSPVIVFGDHTRILKFINFPFAIGADGVKVLSIDTDQAYPLYIYYFLKFLKIPNAGYSRHYKFLKEKKIALPKNIEDQKRIAKLLNECEVLTQKREESIDLLDDLVKSTFMEMFGDPVKNEKGWPIIPMAEAVLNIDSGVSYGGIEKKELEHDELGVLKISAVTSGVFNPKEFKAVKKNVINKKIIPVNKGMVLISRANTKELVAACCIVPENHEQLFMPDKLWSITLAQNKIHPVFFNYLLKNENYRNLIRKKASGGHDSMLNISMQKFRTLTLIKPENQIDFVDIVNRIDSVKSYYKDSLKFLENLYGSISQRAFNGDLNLSKVDISDMEDSKKKELEEVKEEFTAEQQSIIDSIENLGDLIDTYEHTLPSGEVPFNRVKDIRNISIREHLGLSKEIQEENENIEFSYMDKDFFYQFILKEGFPNKTFTVPELEQYARKYILRGTGFEFTYENWKTIVFRFLGAKQSVLEQVFDEKEKTIKLKLTDEAFKI